MIKTMADEHGVKVGRLEGKFRKFNGDNGVQIAILGLLYHKAGYPPTPIEKSYISQRIRIEAEDVPWRM